jgi:F0F1-type ATP synthase assembly protein I
LDKEFLTQAASFFAVGVELIISLIIGKYAGAWIDGRLATGSVFTVLLMLLFFGATIYHGYRLLQQSED